MLTLKVLFSLMPGLVWFALFMLTDIEAERGRLKKEIEVVDSQYSDGSIPAAERDRAYRTRLARAGSISIRQMEIRNKLLSMGHPLSQRTVSATIAY